jgi:signal transduction histidine kinase
MGAPVGIRSTGGRWAWARAARTHARAAAGRQPHADLAIAGIALAVTLLTTAGVPQARPLDAATVGIAVVTAGALVLRRRYPFLTLAVSTIGAELFLLLFKGDGGALVVTAPLIALYTVADLSTRRRGVIIAVLAVLVLGGLHAAVKPASWLGAENIALAALGALAVAAGTAARNRRAYLAEVEARARDAEADREAEAAGRVTEERLRIARDLHDLLGHHLTVIYVQAGVAEHVLTDPPPRAGEAIAHVRAASKSALSELGDTIGLLRRPDDPSAPTEPTTGLAGLADLLTGFRRSGLRITERTEGEAAPVPVTTGLVAYRVIQESLTNVCKHAGPADVEVRLRYGPEELRLVVDNAAGQSITEPATGGHGLVGMRERVHALGGALHAGPRPTGGYRVSAALPLPTRDTP